MNILTACLIVVAVSIQGALCASNCWRLSMRNVPDEMIVHKGLLTPCNTFTAVSELWLGVLPNITMAVNDTKNFLCMKMIASQTGGRNDVIRGCVPKSAGETMCNNLIKVETQRGKNKIVCHYCSEDNCNGGGYFRVSISSALFVLLALIYNTFNCIV